MELPFPQNVDEWSWETIESLPGEAEGQYLEFKSQLHEDDEASRDEWQRDLEREITAFANASGGIIVFGVADDGSPSLIEPPEHEVNQSVTRLIKNTTPRVELEISDPIYPDGVDTERFVLVVRIEEANRKPVLTGDSAVYFRLNDRKEPMSREQMESLFVESDRRQQSIRQLEMEIDRFTEAFDDLNPKSDLPPKYHILNIDSLKEVLRDSTHLYGDEETRENLHRVFLEIRRIEDREVQFLQKKDNLIDSISRDNEQFFRNESQSLERVASRLKRELRRLAESAGLNVDLIDDD